MLEFLITSLKIVFSLANRADQMKCCHMRSSCAFPLFAKVKGVNKVCSAIKLCSYYFSHYVSIDINVTGIL